MTDLVKSLKIGNNSYGIKDEKATPYMTEEDSKNYNFSGKYRDEVITDTRSYVMNDGKIIQKGCSWNTTDLVSTNGLKNMAANSDICVILCSGGDTYYYSTDGVTWNSGTLPVSGSWEAVCWTGTRFTAVRRSGKDVIYSSDGLTWTTATQLTNSAQWIDIACGDGKIVVVAKSSNKALYSTDGISWTETTMPSSSSWNRVTYGNGMFVAVSTSATAAYSTDGINWTAATLPESTSWGSVAYYNGRFITSSETSTSAATSTDGINWTSLALGLDSPCYTMSTSFGFIFITATDSFWSKDLITFNTITGIQERGGLGVPRGTVSSDRVYFYPLSSATPKKIKTLDISTIHSQSEDIKAAELFFEYGNGRYVVTSTVSRGSTYPRICSSTDGLNWKSTIVMQATSYQQIKFGLNNFVTVGGDGSVLYSSDGTTWTAATLPSVSLGVAKRIASGGSNFLVFSYNSNVALYSTDDGVTWSSTTLPSSSDWYAGFYVDGKFFVFTYNGTYAYSSDCISWTSSSTPISASCVTYGNGKFVVSTGTSVAYSSDGINWSSTTIPYSNAAESVVYGSGLFLIPSNSGHASYSYDGITWYPMNVPYQYSFVPIIANGIIYIYTEESLLYSCDKGKTWSTLSIEVPEMYSQGMLGNANGLVFGYRCGLSSGKSWIDTFKTSLKDTKELSYTKSEVDTALASKQGTLTAGTNITIDSNNVISATGGEVSLTDIATAGTGISFTDVSDHVVSADKIGSVVFTSGKFTPSSSNYLQLTSNSISGYTGSLFTGNYNWAWTVKFKSPADLTKMYRIFTMGSATNNFNIWCSITEGTDPAGFVHLGIDTSNGWINVAHTPVSSGTILRPSTWYWVRISRDITQSQYKLEISTDGTNWTVEAVTSSTYGLYNTNSNFYLSQVTDSYLPLEYDLSGCSFTSNYGTGVDWVAYAPMKQINNTGLINTATGSNSLTIGGTANTYNKSVNVGSGSQSTEYQSVAVGVNSSAASSGTAIGYNAKATGTQALAIGRDAIASGTFAIQIGQGTNSTAGTMQVSLQKNGNTVLLDSSGNIPAARLSNIYEIVQTMPASPTSGKIYFVTGSTT